MPEWTPDLLKEYVDQRLQDRQDLLDERFATQKDAIAEARTVIIDQLAGFPELYAKVTTTDQLRETIQGIQGDHVGRGEYDTLKAFQSKAIGALLIVSFLMPIITGVIVYLLTTATK